MNLQGHASNPMCHNRSRTRVRGFGALCMAPTQHGTSLASGLSTAIPRSTSKGRDIDRSRPENY